MKPRAASATGDVSRASVAGRQSLAEQLDPRRAAGVHHPGQRLGGPRQGIEEAECGRHRRSGLVPCPVTGYSAPVIVGFKHRGLKRFFESGDTRGLKASHVPKVRRILARLNSAATTRDLDAPGLRLHPLKGSRKGQWAVDVDRNWRITFTFDGRNCYDVNYEDYH